MEVESIAQLTQEDMRIGNLPLMFHRCLQRSLSRFMLLIISHNGESWLFSAKMAPSSAKRGVVWVKEIILPVQPPLLAQPFTIDKEKW